MHVRQYHSRIYSARRCEILGNRALRGLSFAQGQDAIRRLLSLSLSFSFSCSGPREKAVHSDLIPAGSKPRGSDHVDENGGGRARRANVYEKYAPCHRSLNASRVSAYMAWSSTHQVSVTPKRENASVACARDWHASSSFGRRSGEFKTCQLRSAHLERASVSSREIARYRKVYVANVTRVETRDLSRVAD